MTPPPLNDACLAILLACELLGAAAQTVHLPLLLARRGGAEGRLGAAFELLVAAHLYMAVDFTCCCAFVGNPYLAPVALGAGWSWRLWANAAAFACGAALAVRKKDPLDLMAAALLALCAPPAMEALGGVWNLVAIVDAPFFLARALLALVGDVQRHKSELTRFSIAETMNTVPVGALVAAAGPRAPYRPGRPARHVGRHRKKRAARPPLEGARRRPWPARRHRCAQRARAPPQEDRRARDRPSR